MELSNHWNEIVSVLNNGKKSNRHFSVATVDQDGNPHITPIGHFFFRDNMTGFYFEAYSEAMPKNFETNKNICLMTVNSNPVFWLKSLTAGKFAAPPAVRLYGIVGEPRAATQQELQQYKQSIRITQFLKGHKLLWQGLDRVRDVQFTHFKPVKYPAMCEDLWQQG